MFGGVLQAPQWDRGQVSLTKIGVISDSYLEIGSIFSDTISVITTASTEKIFSLVLQEFHDQFLPKWGGGGAASRVAMPMRINLLNELIKI